MLVGLRFMLEALALGKHLASAVKMLTVPGASLPDLPMTAFTTGGAVTPSDLSACGGNVLSAATLTAAAIALTGAPRAFVQCAMRHIALALVVLASYDVAERVAMQQSDEADVSVMPRPAWLATVPPALEADVSAALRELTAGLFESAPRRALTRAWVSGKGLTPATASWLNDESPAERALTSCPRVTSPSTAVRSVSSAFKIVRPLGRGVYLAKPVSGGDDAQQVVLQRWPDPRRQASEGFPASSFTELQRLHTIHRDAVAHADPGHAKRYPCVVRRALTWCRSVGHA